MTVKPTVLARGGNIPSTWPVSLGSYEVATGSSMSTPLISGVIALGMVRAYDAEFSNRTVLSTLGISFNDTENRDDSAEFTVTNNGDEDMAYHISNIPASTAFNEDGTKPGRITDDHAMLEFPAEKLALGPGEEATIKSRRDLQCQTSRCCLYGPAGSQSTHPTERARASRISGLGKPPGSAHHVRGAGARRIRLVQDPVPDNSTFVLPPPQGLDWCNYTPGVYNEIRKLTFPGPQIPFVTGSRLAGVGIVRVADGELVGPLPGSPIPRNPPLDSELL